MKKIIAILLLVTCLLFALTACGGDKTPATENPSNSDSPVTTDEPSSEAPSDTVDPNAAITEEMVRSHAVAPAEDFSYDVADDGVTIRSYKGSDTIVVIPEKIEGKPVTALKNLVFGNNSTVRAVLIPETVKELNQVFINNKCVEIVICEGTETIYGTTFGFCSALREVYLGESIANLYENTFDGCENLTIYAPAGSYAETFANENNIPFQAE